jgi:glutathione peroxidase
MEKIYDLKALTSKGQELSFSQFKGKVLLIVNTASKCGFTPQFEGLEALNKKYKDKGLVVIGFPCNQFAGQDPGTDSEISEFCQLNYGVSFLMMKKSDVNGPQTNAIFKFLKSKAGFAGFDPAHPLSKLLDEMLSKNDPDYASKPDIKWNFTKFLVSKDGNEIIRFEPTATPTDMEASIEKLIKE